MSTIHCCQIETEVCRILEANFLDHDHLAIFREILSKRLFADLLGPGQLMRSDAEERLTSPPFTPHSTSAGRGAPTRRRPLNPATLVTLTLRNSGTNLSHK
jgi:hypothetical protein